jgi:hypothetical protein
MKINYFKQGDLVYYMRQNCRTRVGIIVGDSKVNAYGNSGPLPGSGKVYSVFIEGHVVQIYEGYLNRPVPDVQGNY